MIFIDSNIPMYLVGAPHPHKADARRVIEEAIMQEQRLVTDAEVLQEILHRYRAINRLDAMQTAFDVLAGIVDEIFPVEALDVNKAKDILLESKRISARDALHIAVMHRHKVESIASFDRGFDGVQGIHRLH